MITNKSVAMDTARILYNNDQLLYCRDQMDRLGRTPTNQIRASTFKWIHLFVIGLKPVRTIRRLIDWLTTLCVT